MKLSPELEEKLDGDEAILRYLDLCKIAYSAGDHSALFPALTLCAQYQAVIPEWAADAILAGGEAIARGDCPDFNTLFGLPSASAKRNAQKKRQREAQIRENEALVCGKLIAYRCEGGTFNVEDAFDAVASDAGLPRRIVEEIYRRNPGLKVIPKGNPENAVHRALNAKLPMPRRRGRKIL
ncbi:MAG: hypothetical protein LJE59_07105 [Chromatiaceae bacterium]|nr:hypothetical protein [Chromatiaceae bacterium]